MSLSNPSLRGPFSIAGIKWKRSPRQNLELLYVLVLKEFKVRYKSSFLGYVWALANPLAYTLVYYVAFKVIVRIEMENFAVYLISGLFPWTWMANTLVQSSVSFRNNSALMKKVRLQAPVLPLSSAVQEMLHFFFALPVLILFLVFSGYPFHLSWILLIPVMACLQLIIVYPLGVVLAISNVLVRDVEYLVALSLSLLFFLTPIVYPTSLIPEPYRLYFLMNPFFPLIESWRSVFYDGVLSAGMFALSLAYGAVFAVVGLAVHKKLGHRVAELL